MMKKGALQISFGWLFAIIVGAFIIFLAIFGVTKFVNTEQTTVDAKTSSQIGILLNPLETSFESAKTTSFSLPAESKINNRCSKSGIFGKQLISVSQKNFNKWSETNLEVSFQNKYIFSRASVEGKKFYIFSKPFEFPFKVSDLIYITSSEETYCFVDASRDIEDEIEDLKQPNLLMGEDCLETSIDVCFSGSCDIEVHSNYIEKSGERLYFETDALMYAAIFADVDVYKCQVKRLMQRIEVLALIYRDKAVSINSMCDLEMVSELDGLSQLAEGFKASSDLNQLVGLVENLNDKNYAEGVCGLW
jgi:hypothetical protein